MKQAVDAKSAGRDGDRRACAWLAAAAAALTACGGLASDPSTEGIAAELDQPVYSYSESFEQGFGGWITDHHLQCEPGCGLLDWSITRSPVRPFDGAFGLRGYLNGNHDDGTIWIERGFSIRPPARARYRVTLSFYLWSDGQSSVNAWPVVAYIGYKNPEQESDFRIIGQTNQAAGWKPYTLVQTVSFDDARPLQVALGFGATWEVARTYFIDLVSLKVE